MVKAFVYIIISIIMVFALVGCSNKLPDNDSHPQSSFSDSSQNLTKADLMFDSLKELIPILNSIETQMEQYTFRVEFFYVNNELNIVANDNNRDEIEKNDILSADIKSILDNQYVSSIVWKYSESSKSFYLLVGLKQVRSGYISTIERCNESISKGNRLITDDWYYYELAGE